MKTETKTITIPELRPGYLLFYHGVSSFAKKIQWFQRLKFSNQHLIYQGEKFYFWKLNHVGHLDKDFVGDNLVYEQDSPGKYQVNRLDEEYIKGKGDVWIGVPKISDEELQEAMKGLRKDAQILVAEDSFLNYSYKSIIGFAVNAAWYKLFKKEIWVTGIPNGTTCSQIVAKLYQDWLAFFISDKWWTWFPCELAMDEKIELRKLIYQKQYD